MAQGVASSPRPEASQVTGHAAGRMPAVRLDLAERRVLLAFGDLLALNATLLIVIRLIPRPAWLELPAMVPLDWIWFAVLSGVWLTAAILTECYDLRVAASRFSSPYRAASVATLVLLIYTFVPFVTPPVLKSRLMWAAMMVIGLATMGAWRLLYASTVGNPVLVTRAVIVGAGESGRLSADAIARHAPGLYRVLGVVVASDDESRAPVAGRPVLGTGSDLPRLLASLPLDELIVASSGPLPADAYRAIASAYENGIRVTSMTQLYEGLTGRIPVEHIGDQWLAVLPQASRAGLSYALIKRLMDIVGGLLGLVATLVLVAPLALAIKLDSPGPVFFAQERVGLRGRLFRIFKFRTVAQGGGAATALTIWDRKATRPTRVGRWLRRTRLDELPQFWNVLKGEMSLVGPRPFVPQEIDELQRRIPFFRSRLLAKPGITGWAQVHGGYGVTIGDELEKLQYDLYYIRHQSLALDLVVVIKTISVVLRLSGR